MLIYHEAVPIRMTAAVCGCPTYQRQKVALHALSTYNHASLEKGSAGFGLQNV
jgi:hypothetical protein